MSTPSRSAHTASCSVAPARKVSAATKRTFLPACLKAAAIFPIVVVFPAPLTPTNMITVGPSGAICKPVCSPSPAASYSSTIFSMITLETSCLVLAFCNFTSSRRASESCWVISKPTSDSISKSSRSSKKSSSTCRKLAKNLFNRAPNPDRDLAKPFSYLPSAGSSTAAGSVAVAATSVATTSAALLGAGAAELSAALDSLPASAGSGLTDAPEATGAMSLASAVTLAASSSLTGSAGVTVSGAGTCAVALGVAADSPGPSSPADGWGSADSEADSAAGCDSSASTGAGAGAADSLTGLALLVGVGAPLCSLSSLVGAATGCSGSAGCFFRRKISNNPIFSLPYFVWAALRV